MKFRVVQENLRKVLWGRIEAGELTGLRLAEQTGFKQAHISNFLNRKRGLSLEGMDKVLSVQHLSVLDLLDPAEINKRASIIPPTDDEFENIAITEPKIAVSEALIMSMHVKEMVKFRRSFLKKLKEGLEGDRAGWVRFVAIKADAREGTSMYPRTLPGATLLIDRHYNSLAPYRKGENNMYAVRKDDQCAIRYVEQIENYLLLRAQNPSYHVEMITMKEGQKSSDFVIGRVCYVGIET